MELHALPAQPMQPGTQQRCRFHRLRKDPARGAHEGFDAQRMHPGAQLGRAETLEHRRKPGRRLAKARQEGFEGFGVRDVQPALAGQQELASHRRHRVEDFDATAAQRERFGGHQPRRSAAHHRHAAGSGQPGRLHGQRARERGAAAPG